MIETSFVKELKRLDLIAKKKIIDKHKGKEILGIDLDGIYSQFK